MQLALELPLKPILLPKKTWDDILCSIDMESDNHARLTSVHEKRSLGQIFTPLSMARQLISLIPDFSVNDMKYADPGAGTGILSAALLARHSCESTLPPQSLIAYESDIRLHAQWKQNFGDICTQFGIKKTNFQLFRDFYKNAESILNTGKPLQGGKVTRLITNPPYKKLSANDPISILLKRHGIYAPNHYAAFLALSVEWLEEEGDLLAIIPRSLFNGTYFKNFRNWLSAKVSIEHIVAYQSRSNFGRNVLQENVCLYLKKSNQRPLIRVTLCEHAEAIATHDLLIPQEQILGGLWKLPSTPAQLNALQENSALPETIESLGLTVKTGSVEVHRPECKNSYPVRVIYSRDFNDKGEITWGETKKPRTFALGRARHLLPDDNSGYVVIKRITANNGNKHRIIPTWISQQSTGYPEISFDNHVQVFSAKGNSLSEKVGMALINFLRSEGANLCMSSISGTTQVNIDDLKELRFPNVFKGQLD